MCRSAHCHAIAKPPAGLQVVLILERCPIGQHSTRHSWLRNLWQLPVASLGYPLVLVQLACWRSKARRIAQAMKHPGRRPSQAACP